MKIIIEQQEAIEEVLQSLSSVVDNKYYYLPGWFEKQENGEFQFHHMNKLPSKLVTILEEQRKLETEPKKSKK